MIYFQSQVDQLLKSKDSEITLLKAENERLREGAEYEKKRADAAVDALLNQKDIPSISVPKRERGFESEIERQVQGLSVIGQEIGEEAVK